MDIKKQLEEKSFKVHDTYHFLKLNLEKTELIRLSDILDIISSQLEPQVMQKIAVINNNLENYIVKHWSAKEITSEVGLSHWLKLQEVYSELNKLLKGNTESNFSA